MPEILNYYSNNFYKICQIDEIVANTDVKINLMADGFFIVDKCEGGGKLLTEYNNKLLNIKDFLNIIYLVLIILTFVLLIKRKAKKT